MRCHCSDKLRTNRYGRMYVPDEDEAIQGNSIWWREEGLIQTGSWIIRLVYKRPQYLVFPTSSLVSVLPLFHEYTPSMLSKESKVILITGASGFIATHIVADFLRAGYQVRGTVRSSSTAKAVRQSFAQYAEQLSLTIVEDVGRPGAFDSAVQGVHGAIHTATPLQISNVEDHERDLLHPAIDGTLNILDSLHRYAPQVSRLVITSSFAAMLNFSQGRWPGHVYSETDWNLDPYEVAASNDTPDARAYFTAKALAERAAWGFVKTVRPSFDVATILPPMVYGPNTNATARLGQLNASSADIYRLMAPQSKPSDAVPANLFWSFVDVRDVALAHLRAFEVPAAGGERFFIAQGNFTYQLLVDALREGIPEIRHRVPIGNPGRGQVPEALYTVDTSKSRRVLGIRYRGLEETAVDAARSLLELEGGA